VTRTIGMCRGVMLATIIIIFFAGLSAQQLTASVVAVGTCVANVVQFTTIQGAVNAVPSGSTIKVCPAKYAEQVVINKDLTLIGVNSGSADNPVLVIPLGGFVPNTTSLTSGHPIAAQILVQSPATAGHHQQPRRRWQQQQFE
jgi:pectin methylesterase-like acyl-CoA thioesterase